MSYSAEFKTIDSILASGGDTRAVDAFALALIKTERQARKLFTYLVFQFPVFTASDTDSLRKTLANHRDVYFDGGIAGLNALSPVTVKDLVGSEHDRLWKRLAEFKKHRDKIFHGQLTIDGLERAYLEKGIDDIRLWCGELSASAEREFDYDGFGRNSFRKSSISGLSNRLRVQIESLKEYSEFISAHMKRRSNKPLQPTAEKRGG